MLTCPGYVARYIIWINATDKVAAKERLEKHVFYCAECRRQAAELTQAAASATMPELDRAVEELERMDNGQKRTKTEVCREPSAPGA